jgi:hypothetical protein
MATASQRRYIFFLFAGLLLALASGWWGRGTVAQTLLVAVAVLAGVGLAALVAAVRLLTRFVRRGDGRPASTAGHRVLGLALVAALQVSSIPLGRWFHVRDVAAAKDFCERLIATLDRERLQKGSYPSDPPSPSVSDTVLPRLLSGEHYYVTDGTVFVLSFGERDGTTPHVNLYSSQSRTWSRF